MVMLDAPMKYSANYIEMLARRRMDEKSTPSGTLKMVENGPGDRLRTVITQNMKPGRS
jgi:hypothetical protein